MLAGTGFTSEDADRSFKADRQIVNETAARQLGYDPSNAVGKSINWGKHYEISAVVKDYYHRSLKEAIEPIIYVPQHNNACYTIMIKMQDIPKKMAAVRSLCEKLYPGNPFEYSLLKESYDTFYANEQRGGTVALSISVLVVVIACLGLAGLSIFTAKRRYKEMGIRKVLGAGVPSLFALLSKEFIWLAATAFVIAVPVAWLAMHQWLEAFAYRISIP